MDNCMKTECLDQSACFSDNCNIFDQNLKLKTENQNLIIREQVLENENQ